MPILHKATCDNYFIVKCLLKSNVSRVYLLNNCVELVWYKKGETKTANTNFTWSCLVFPNRFVFSYFNSSILYSVHLFSIWWSFAINLIIFECFVPNIRLLLKTCNFYVADFTVLIDVFYMKFRFCETYKIANSVTRNLLIETLSNFRTIKEAKCWFTLYLRMYFYFSNVIPPSFFAFHIPLIFAR